MSSPLRQRIEDYSAKLTEYLREREANSLRGQPERLRELELITSQELLKKFAWKVAIIAAVVTFFGMPMLAAVFRPFLPEILSHILWALIKLGMAISGALFALAAYFTFWSPDDRG